jgi:hypothetical protein
MPTVAETYQVKRLLSDLVVAGGGGGSETSEKRRRVRFDDDNYIREDARCWEGGVENDDEAEEEEGQVYFVLSIGADGEWDYTIKETEEEEEEEEERGWGLVMPLPPTEGRAKISRPSSPFAGCDRSLCEELYPPSSSSSSSSSLDNGTEDEPQNGAAAPPSSSGGGLGNNLWIRVDCDASDDPVAAAPMPPLITPPSSPRWVRTLSADGGTTETATICEWPSNLTVDNAITAALELVPYAQALRIRRMSAVGP